jgi:peptidyl-prolyl cis-trans isomerase-like 2
MTDSMKIIAIQTQPTTAHVYSWEAYQELNIKSKNYQNLMTGISFDPKNDVILLNDPDTVTTPSNYSTTFHRSQQGRPLNRDTKPTIQHSLTTMRAMNQLQSQSQLRQKQQLQTTNIVPATTTSTPQYSAEAVTGYKATSGLVSSSLTSTSTVLTNTNESRQATQEEILHAQFNHMKQRKAKGYCTLHTTLGDIGIELNCDITPRMCTKFLGLADNGKYNNT